MRQLVFWPRKVLGQRLRSHFHRRDHIQLERSCVMKIWVKLNGTILSKLGANCSSPGLSPSSNLEVEQLNFRQLFRVCFLELYCRKQLLWLLVGNYCYCLNYFTFLALKTAKTRDENEESFDHNLGLIIRACFLRFPPINPVGRSSACRLRLSDI